MENNQTIEALLGEIKTLNEKVTEISKNLSVLVKVTEEREKRFAERGARPQGGDRGTERGSFRTRTTDRGESSWGNNTGGFAGRGRDDRNRGGNKG